jgi:hypothetical protein
MDRLLAILLTAMSGAALAQTTGTVNPSPAPVEPSVKGDVPPGGCMPIGLTASEEIVFPIQCKEFLERERGKAVEQKPAALEEKPAQAAKQPDNASPAESKPVAKPVETASLPKKRSVEAKPRERRKVSRREKKRSLPPLDLGAPLPMDIDEPDETGTIFSPR